MKQTQKDNNNLIRNLGHLRIDQLIILKLNIQIFKNDFHLESSEYLQGFLFSLLIYFGSFFMYFFITLYLELINQLLT